MWRKHADCGIKKGPKHQVEIYQASEELDYLSGAFA